MNSIPSVEIDSSDHVAKITKTTCPYCGVGCGVSVNVQQKPQGPVVQVEGDAEHPSNFGRLCIKGSRLADTLGLETRLLQPMFGRKPLRTVTTWDAAINKIADKFQSCIDKYGRDSIAFYVSGQLLTEDYYVVNKFVKGYLGTANIDTNSR
ncbi:molybdopterin-dependent oxidoreductase, partial [Acinetobacter baumannii]